MHCVRIELGGVLLPSCLVANYRYAAGIVPATDLIIPIVRLFEGDKLLTCFVWFPSSYRSVS